MKIKYNIKQENCDRSRHGGMSSIEYTNFQYADYREIAKLIFVY
jgi:hypothetical protein